MIILDTTYCRFEVYNYTSQDTNEKVAYQIIQF